MWDKIADIKLKQQTQLTQLGNLKTFFYDLKVSLDQYREQVKGHLQKAELDRSYFPQLQNGMMQHVRHLEAFSL